MVQSRESSERQDQETQQACEISCERDYERKRHHRRFWQQTQTVERHESEASNTKWEHEMCRHREESKVSADSVHQND